MHFFAVHCAGLENTPFNTRSAMRASACVGLGIIAGLCHEILSAMFQHQLEIMTATGTATANCKVILLRAVQGCVDKAMLIRYLQSFAGLFQGYGPRPSGRDPLVGKIVEKETDLDRLVTSLIMSSAETVRYGECPSIAK
jgi:hypothetical protein